MAIDVVAGMRVFTAVVEAGSFAGAADKLDLFDSRPTEFASRHQEPAVVTAAMQRVGEGDLTARLSAREGDTTSLLAAMTSAFVHKCPVRAGVPVGAE